MIEGDEKLELGMMTINTETLHEISFLCVDVSMCICACTRVCESFLSASVLPLCCREEPTNKKLITCNIYCTDANMPVARSKSVEEMLIMCVCKPGM